MSIIRSKERSKYHVISTEDVFKHGMEKACILGNIQEMSFIEGEKVSRSELYIYFPYIEKERFYLLLKELIQDGFLVIKESENESR